MPTQIHAKTEFPVPGAKGGAETLRNGAYRVQLLGTLTLSHLIPELAFSPTYSAVMVNS